MKKNPNQIWDKIIFCGFAALLFFSPLIFLSVSYELFEFNKIIFVYLITIVITWAWLGKIISGKISHQKTFWFWPLIFFLISQLISTILSVDRHTSLLGYYSRFNGGLLSSFCYVLLYLVWTNNISREQTKKLLKIIFASGLLVAGYGIAQHFGIDKHLWIQDVQNRVFSTLGQPNWLAAYLNILIFLLLGTAFNKGKSLLPDKVSFFIFGFYYLCLLYTKSRSGFIGFLIPIIIWMIIKVRQQKNRKNALVIFSITLIVSLVARIPFNLRSKINISFLSDVEPIPVEQETKTDSKQELLITPSSDIRKIVWQGALKLWRRYPVFGTGTETFAYTYYWTRPREHNLTSEWDFLYNKAHNEYLNFAANNGTIGLIAYLLLPVSFLFFIFKKTRGEKTLALATTLAYLSILITNFFGFSVVSVSLFFFLIPAMIVEPPKKSTDLFSKLPTGMAKTIRKSSLLIITFLAVFGLIKVGHYWLADFYFAKGTKQTNAGMMETGLANIDKAISFNPSEPTFYAKRAIVLSQIVASANKDKTGDLEKIVAQAIEDSQRALLISPFHINFYKNQTRVWYYLTFYNSDFLNSAIGTLNLAKELAPTDPKIFYNLGVIYQTLDQKDQAIKSFEKALELKPNYQQAQKSLQEVQGSI